MPRKTTPSPRRAARDHAARIVGTLERLYPDARCALNHDDAYQLLVATILSAQCTDARVNLVTPAFFDRFPDAGTLACSESSEVEGLIRSAGFFRTKAKNLRAMAEKIVADHGGTVPADLDALTSLPGVGRKTANVVLGNAFQIASGIVVDTHVKRVAFRLGLTKHKDPERIEKELNDLIPSEHWVDLSHRLIEHGRKVCVARKPRCGDCALATLCAKRGVTPAA